MPFLFVVWTNFHIQFIYGLLLPGLLAAITTAERWAARWWAAGQAGSGNGSTSSPLTLWVIVAACLAATLVNPYTVGLYRVISELVRETFVYSVIAEFQPLNFREFAHYIQLLLAAGAFFALGRRKLDLYKLALLIITSLVSFRSIRDAWFVCITAAAIIAYSFPISSTNPQHPPT